MLLVQMINSSRKLNPVNLNLTQMSQIVIILMFLKKIWVEMQDYFRQYHTKNKLKWNVQIYADSEFFLIFLGLEVSYFILYILLMLFMDINKSLEISWTPIAAYKNIKTLREKTLKIHTFNFLWCRHYDVKFLKLFWSVLFTKYLDIFCESLESITHSGEK